MLLILEFLFFQLFANIFFNIKVNFELIYIIRFSSPLTSEDVIKTVVSTHLGWSMRPHVVLGEKE